MKTVCSIKIRKLAKYEKEWRRKVEEERLAVDPLTRFQTENKKLIADNMRSDEKSRAVYQPPPPYRLSLIPLVSLFNSHS